jgi:hypothetical protein
VLEVWSGRGMILRGYRDGLVSIALSLQRIFTILMCFVSDVQYISIGNAVSISKEVRALY